MMSKKKILFYDIETTPLMAYIWRPGKQVVRHQQLVEGAELTDIICLAYCWNDGKPAKVIGWGYEEQNSKPIIELFDELASQADIVIGKNSDRFDNKHMNTRRLIEGLPCSPEWTKYTDDLEKQIRKHFALPSYSLDYFSKLIGIGGKVSMQFGDWIDIVEQRDEKAYKKMLRYNKKDTEDTRAIWEYCEKHITPKYQMPAQKGVPTCKNCGGENLTKDGVRRQGKNTYQEYRCKDCVAYAGRWKVNR